MIINNFDAFRASIRPTKADSPLIIDANAVLTGTITRECLKAIAGWNPQAACGLGSDQAILLIFNKYYPNSRCFEALKGHFQGLNWPRKEWLVHEVHSFFTSNNHLTFRPNSNDDLPLAFCCCFLKRPFLISELKV